MSSADRETLVRQINDVERILTGLRTARDAQVIADYQRGKSKYRLAKDWGVNEKTIKRIVDSAQAPHAQNHHNEHYANAESAAETEGDYEHAAEIAEEAQLKDWAPSQGTRQASSALSDA